MNCLCLNFSNILVIVYEDVGDFNKEFHTRQFTLVMEIHKGIIGSTWVVTEWEEALIRVKTQFATAACLVETFADDTDDLPMNLKVGSSKFMTVTEKRL